MILTFGEFVNENKGEYYKGRLIPKKYLTRKKNAMKKEIETFRGKKVYKQKWEADYDHRTGKRIKTKKSPATIAYDKMFNENILMFDDYLLVESISTIKKILKEKSEKSSIPYNILKKVFDRGMAAWNTGHRSGVAQHQWAIGRVNSFITGVGKSRKADADLWKEAKEFIN